MDTGRTEAKKQQRGFISESLRFAIVAFLIIVPFRLWIAQPFIVRGASMDPTFFDGEYLIIDELTYHLRDPLRDEVVVFRYPLNPKTFFIKRVIGLPGEQVIIRNGQITIRKNDGEQFALPEAYFHDNVFTAPDGVFTLGDREYFVMGDNRAQSLDSRRWGALTRGMIVGRALVRLWPVARAAVLPGI